MLNKYKIKNLCYDEKDLLIETLVELLDENEENDWVTIALEKINKIHNVLNVEIEEYIKKYYNDECLNNKEIIKGIWFPHVTEARLLVVYDNTLPKYLYNVIQPTRYPHLTVDIINDNEVGKIQLPPTWGEWEDGIEIT